MVLVIDELLGEIIHDDVVVRWHEMRSHINIEYIEMNIITEKFKLN